MHNFSPLLADTQHAIWSGVNRRRKPEDPDKPIVAISHHWRASLDLRTPRDLENSPRHDSERQAIRIRLTHSNEKMHDTRMLLQRKYASRGYTSSHLHKAPESLPLMAYQGDQVIGTLTLGLDTPKGLMIEELYQHEIDHLRAAGRKICEVTKLAVDQPQESKRVLGALFHIAYIYSHVMGHTDVVVEVHPRHVSFYKRMLGFQEYGPERLCSRVNAPAVMLRIEIEHVERQIELLGGQRETARDRRSLYPYFLTKKDEAGIIKRLIRMNQ
ncbi:MAG: hypothetical protein V4443_01180 [Pseudomonadota bacterium]